MDSHRSTVSRTSSVGWDAARCRGSQPRLSDSLKAKVCLSISLRVQTSPGHHGNRKKDFWETETPRTLRNRGNLLKVLWTVSPLPSLHFISLPPLCLFISLSLSVCRAASLLMPGSPPLQLLALWLFRWEPAAQTQTHRFVMVKVFSRVMSSLPCSMAARTLRFSSVAAAKLGAGRTGSRGSAGQSARFDRTVKGFFWRMLKFGRGSLTLQQTWEKHLGRTLGCWAGWCSRWAPLHRILHKCSSLCRDKTRDCSWWTALSTSGLTWYQLISLVTWGQQSETQVQHLTYYRLIGAEVALHLISGFLSAAARLTNAEQEVNSETVNTSWNQSELKEANKRLLICTLDSFIPNGDITDAAPQLSFTSPSKISDTPQTMCYFFL